MEVKTKTICLIIDGKKLNAAPQEKMLWAALDNDIYIPHLCAMREREPFASCRLCFVEVEGKDLPVTACTEEVKEGMVVNTKGPRALRLARTALELILASHPVDCAHCKKSGSCELQKVAKHLGVKLNTKRFQKIPTNLPIDETSPHYIYDPNKCLLCGKCIFTCQERGKNIIGFAHRGFKRIVTAFADEPRGPLCEDCFECVSICPVGALVLKEKK